MSNFNDLNNDALYCILNLFNDHDMLTFRAVSKLFLDTSNSILRRKYELDIIKLLQGLRMKCEKVPIKYILMKASFLPVTQPVYKCSRCKRDIHALGECKSCKSMKNYMKYSRIVKRIVLGPSLLLCGMCLVVSYMRLSVPLRSQRLK